MNFISLAIGILCILMSSIIANEIEDKSTPKISRVRNRCPSIKTFLKNGRVRIRSKGRIAKFICDNGYDLVGSRFATCVRSQWNKAIPICVSGGCPLIENPLNGQTNSTFKGALLAFTCDPGYVLNGSPNIYCDGYNWSNTVPTCDIAIPNPKLTCDFEESTICGWTNDKNHDFDWKRHQFSTPSGHVGTGPSYDHTLGKGKEGYYMYIEASSPRKQNDKARLFSPVYSSDLTPGCFVFWYHMYGATTGTLRVFMKKETQMFQELTPVWEKEGEQGNLWLQSSLSIPKLKEKFQIIIEGIRGNNYAGDTAIDDVGLYSTPCEELAFTNITKEFDSCQGRCNVEMEENSTCSCTEECLQNSTCCDDYENFCTANRTFIFGPEPQPKPSITSNQTNFSTLTTRMATGESKSLPNSITSTVNSTIQPYISTSNDFITKLTTLLNSSFITTVSNKFKTEMAETTTEYQTVQKINKTSELSTANLSETSTSVKLSKITNTINLDVSFTTIASVSTMKDMVSVNANNITEFLTTETTGGTTISKNTTTYKPVTTSKKTSQQSSMMQTVPSRKITTVFIIQDSTTVPNTTTIKPTTLPNTTTRKPTTVPITTTRKPTTVPNKTTRKSTTVFSTTRRKPATVFSTTRRKPTSILNTTTKKPTSVFSTTRRKPTTVPNTTTRKSTTVPYTTTRKPTTVPNTTRRKTTAIPNTTKPPTTIFYTTTQQPIKITKWIPQQQTTTKRDITTEKFKNSSLINEITERMTTVQNITKATFTKVKSTRYPMTKPQTTVTVTKKTTTTMNPTAMFTTKNTKRLPFSIQTSTRTTEKSMSTSQSNLFTTSTTTTSEKTKTYPKISQPTRKVSTTAPIKDLTTELSTKSTEKTQKESKTQKHLTTTTTTFTSKTDTNLKEMTELMWTIDYSSRTKKKIVPRRPSKAKTSDSLTVIVVVSVGITITTLFLIAIICFLARKRKSSQNKLAEDSEMKFLSDNEIFEFSDPSLSINS